MKLSETKEIFEIMKKTGIHNDPASLSAAELEELSKNPDIRNRVLKYWHKIIPILIRNSRWILHT